MDLLEKAFNSKNVKIYTTTIKDEFGDDEIIPYFCGRDACNILEYTNYRNILNTYIDDDCKMSLKDLLNLGVPKTSTPTKVNFNHNELQQTELKIKFIF